MEYVLNFDGQQVPISKQESESQVMDIDFGGLMVQFEKQNNGDFMAVNAMNGWGENIADQVGGKIATVQKTLNP